MILGGGRTGISWPSAPSQHERLPGEATGSCERSVNNDEALLSLSRKRRVLAATQASAYARAELFGHVANTVTLAARDVTGRRRAAMWVGREQAVVAVEVHTRPLGAQGDDLTLLCAQELTGDVLVLTMPVARVPLVWLWWAGPIEEGQGQGATLTDVQAIERRISAPEEPLPEHGRELAAMWAAPWREWSIRQEATGRRLRYVSVRGHGVYVERSCPGELTFGPRPSGLVWGDLVELYCSLEPVRRLAGRTIRW